MKKRVKRSAKLAWGVFVWADSRNDARAWRRRIMDTYPLSEAVVRPAVTVVKARKP